MLKKIAVLCLVGYSGLVCAQGSPFLSDANGRPVITSSGNYTSDGSPFLFEDYFPSEITFQNGKVYKDVKAKLNVTENQVLFMDENGNELQASTPIKSLKIIKPGSAEIFLESPGSSLNTSRSPVYQVLVNNDKVKLLKQIAITYTEARKYGEGGMTRTYRKKETYSVAFAGQSPQKFESNKSSVAALFGDKQQQISSYIDEKKLRFKNDADFISVFEYFLTLK